MITALWIAIACLALVLFDGVASAFRDVEDDVRQLREQVETLEARLRDKDDWRDDQDDTHWGT